MGDEYDDIDNFMDGQVIEMPLQDEDIVGNGNANPNPPQIPVRVRMGDSVYSGSCTDASSFNEAELDEALEDVNEDIIDHVDEDGDGLGHRRLLSFETRGGLVREVDWDGQPDGVALIDGYDRLTQAASGHGSTCAAGVKNGDVVFHTCWWKNGTKKLEMVASLKSTNIDVKEAYDSICTILHARVWHGTSCWGDCWRCYGNVMTLVTPTSIRLHRYRNVADMAFYGLDDDDDW